VIETEQRPDWATTDFFNKHMHGAAQFVSDQTVGYLLNQMQMHERHRKVHSPLEAAFLAWWLAQTTASHISGICLECQFDVEVGKKKYRLDFALQPLEYYEFDRLARSGSWPKIAVELDGHEFHERTKEQVKKRDERDRDLQLAGWRVLHYSGSEFNADPRRVVRDTYLAGVSAFSEAQHKLGA
jgi:very-short-patch-repair endonuclease